MFPFVIHSSAMVVDSRSRSHWQGSKDSKKRVIRTCSIISCHALVGLGLHARYTDVTECGYGPIEKDSVDESLREQTKSTSGLTARA